VSRLYVAAVGDVSAANLGVALECAEQEFQLPVFRLPAIAEPPGAFDERRGQYRAVDFLLAVVKASPGDGKIVALTERDIFIPMLTFLFGQAQLGGVAALVSAARLRQEFYGLPADAAVFRRRLRTEVLHEGGHAFGLIHCPDRSCAMSLATSIQQLDLKQDAFCAGCRRALAERVREFRGNET
jgi:archaemetzincin